jgi:heme/copper-type cytochrome/quinol oxidase subunit 2
MGLSFDAFLVPVEELREGQYHLLECDNHVIVPTGATSLSILSDDVLHRWALPAASIKMDATPGRVNHTTLNLTVPAVLYGQCSEICGTNHSFMPITVETVPPSWFKSWALRVS